MPDDLDGLLSESQLTELLEGGTPEGMRRLMGLAWESPASLLDYLPAKCCIAIDERRHGSAHGQQWLDHAIEQHADLSLSIPPLHRPIKEAMALAECFGGFDLAELQENDSYPNAFDLASRPVPAYPNQFGKLGELIKQHQREHHAVWLLSAQPSRAVALLEEHDCITRFVPNAADRQAIERLIEQGTPVALKSRGTADLEGLQLPAWKVVLLTDREFFGQQSLSSSGYVRRRQKRRVERSIPTRCSQGTSWCIATMESVVSKSSRN